MSVKIVSNNGTVITESELEYRKVLITARPLCPVMRKPLSALGGEAIFVNGSDYFISDDGIKKLKEIFGESAIVERFITYD